MGAIRDALHRLQDIETQIRSVREKIEAKRRTVRAHHRKITKLKNQIQEIQERIAQDQKQSDRLELERKTHEEHLVKLRETLNQAKTNKEYAAVLTQLNTDKANALKLEDQVLSALTQVDEQKKKQAELGVQLEKEETLAKELEKSVEEFEEKLSGKLKELETKADQAREDIPATALAIFERACEKHDGEAMAMIKKEHPKREEYTCGGCNLSVPLEIVNALQTSRDAVIQCQICSRIFYLEAPASVPA